MQTYIVDSRFRVNRLTISPTEKPMRRRFRHLVASAVQVLSTATPDSGRVATFSFNSHTLIYLPHITLTSPSRDIPR